MNAGFDSQKSRMPQCGMRAAIIGMPVTGLNPLRGNIAMRRIVHVDFILTRGDMRNETSLQHR